MTTHAELIERLRAIHDEMPMRLWRQAVKEAIAVIEAEGRDAKRMELDSDERIALRMAVNVVVGKIGDGSITGGRDRDAKFRHTANVIEALLSRAAISKAAGDAHE